MEGLWLASYLALWSLVAVLAFVVVLVVRQLGQSFLNTPEAISRDGIPVGEYGPSFLAEDLAGREHNVGGPSVKPKILIFGSAYCQPCRKLVPDLNRFALEFRDEIDLLFISRGTYESTSQFAKESNIGIPVLSGGGDVISDLYGARVTPFAFCLDTEGKVVRKGLVNNYEHLHWLAYGDANSSASQEVILLEINEEKDNVGAHKTR